MKLETFKWTPIAYKAYLDIKLNVIKALELRHPDLFEVFEVACDDSGEEIGGVLNQDGHHVVYFS